MAWTCVMMGSDSGCIWNRDVDGYERKLPIDRTTRTMVFHLFRWGKEANFERESRNIILMC